MKKTLSLLSLLVSAAFCLPAAAAVVQTTGAGNATPAATHLTFAADFEGNVNLASPWSEGGLTFMHPSDVRMNSWLVAPYTVGTSTAANWPAYQWKDVNNGLQVRFTLKRGQNAAPLRLRIGITADYNSARPQVTVNSWTSAIPSAPPKVSRNVTVGTYRGFNRTYSFDIPASQLVVGTNVLTINTVSGTAGAGFLSPALSFDAIDLVPTN